MADFHINVSYVPKTSRRACASLRQNALLLVSLIQQQDAGGRWLPPELRVFDCLFQSEQIEGAKQALIELFDIQVKWAGETGKPAKDSEEPKWMNELKQ